MAGQSVSVAMATYNGARDIRVQLDDIARQTSPPAELVVSDDRSSDDTLAIVERFAGRAHFPVHIYRNERRLGYRENFLRCAERCSSELIAFCDQDDRWHPQKLEIAARHFEADPEILLLHHNADVVDDSGSRLGRVGPAGHAVVPPLVNPPWSFAVGFTQLFRRSLLAFSDLWPSSQDQWHAGERLAHDQWFFFLASALGRIVYVPTPLAQYRQHGRNTFGWNRARTGSQIIPALRLGADAYELRARAAASRMLILTRIGDRLDAVMRDRARRAAAAWRVYARRQDARAALYHADSTRARAQALRTLFAQRAYGGTPWHLGGWDLAKDLSFGLCGFRLPPLSQRIPNGSEA